MPAAACLPRLAGGVAGGDALADVGGLGAGLPQRTGGCRTRGARGGLDPCPSVDDLDHRLLAKTAKQPKLQQRVPQELPLVAGALVHAVQLDSPPPKYELGCSPSSAAPVMLQEQQANSAQMIFSLELVQAAEAALIHLRRRLGTSQD